MTPDETFVAVGRKLAKLASHGAQADDIFRALVTFAVRMAVESSFTEEAFLGVCRDAFVAGRMSRTGNVEPVATDQ